MKVAIVHDWMDAYAGSERVVEQLLHVLPHADVFTLCDFLSDDQRKFLGGRKPKTSFLQNAPWAAKHFRQYLPLMPLAIEQFDLSAYDLVVSSSHAFAKGVLTGPGQLHICYCHTPIRYAWDFQHQYLRQSKLDRGVKGMLARLILHYIRLWDVRTAAGVDTFVANSSYIANRIRKVYGRSSVVIHPPVDTDAFSVETRKDDYYLAASRFVPYKRMDLILSAFRSMTDRRLIVVGDGPELERVKHLATPNVELLGYQPGEVLKSLMQRARGFVFAAEEDFGIMPVEAQACGTPVLCYGRGGVQDSVIPQETGVYFERQETDSICDAVRRFEELTFDPLLIRKNAERFSREAFRKAFRELIYSSIAPATGQWSEDGLQLGVKSAF